MPISPPIIRRYLPEFILAYLATDSSDCVWAGSRGG